MHLLPREQVRVPSHKASTPTNHLLQDKLILTTLGSLAQRRLARGLRLNRSEVIALIASQLHEFIRDGRHSVAELMDLGKKMLGRRHVLVSHIARYIAKEAEGDQKGFRRGYMIFRSRVLFLTGESHWKGDKSAC